LHLPPHQRRRHQCAVRKSWGPPRKVTRKLRVVRER
jgi:hypothetical protein